MKFNLKKFLSGLLVFGSIFAVVLIAFGNNELEDAWGALGKLNPVWLLGIFGCWFTYMFFDAFGYWVYFHSEGFNISIGRTVNASLIGFYYSNITPTSAGGQPMLVNSLRKAGIPVGYGTMCATIRFICNQFAVSFLSLMFYLLNRDFVVSRLGGAVWFFWIGWVVNFAGIPLALMAAFSRKLIQRIVVWIIELCAKIHLLKNKEATIINVTNILDTYHTALKLLVKQPGRVLIQVCSAILSTMGLIGSVYFVYHAFDFSGTPWYQLVTMSFMLYISACYTPLPGASGAQELGFMTYFKGIFPDDKIGLGLLVWRFFTYYMFLIVGVFVVLLEKIIVKREQNRRQHAE